MTRRWLNISSSEQYVCWLSEIVLGQYINGGLITTQGNLRLHFARAVHSRQPLPGRSHFQWTRQWRNDPLCCMTISAIDWSLLQWARYIALSMGKKTPSRRQVMRPIVNMLEDWATRMGNMHKKFGEDRACASGDILADRYTHHILCNRCRGQSNKNH